MDDVFVHLQQAGSCEDELQKPSLHDAAAAGVASMNPDHGDCRAQMRKVF